MSTSFVNVGSIANDGTGDPIRTAFITVNDNFNIINGAIFAGTLPTQLTSTEIITEYLISNTFVSAQSIVSNTVTSHGNLYVSRDGATIIGNVTILGNLNVSGVQAATLGDQQLSSPQSKLHFSSTPLITNDGKDIGTQWQYYLTNEQKAFFGWQNSTQSLVYLDNITETSNIITAGTFGNVQFGSLLLSNTTSSTSNVTGALVVSGGVGVGQDINVQGNIFVGQTANVGNLSIRGYVSGSMNFTGADTIYINGSPVATASSSFSGGAVAFDAAFASGTLSVSPTTGALIVPYGGGLGVSGNINVGGNINANINGNVFTSSQPYITSVGELTSLSMGGQLNARDIIPETNNVYALGGSSNRWNKVWTFDLDVAGTITGASFSGAGATYTGNVALNTGDSAAITTTNSTAEIFNTGASTVKIGGDGTTQFNSELKSTSNDTGAIVVTQGGVSITQGNLYIGGSEGNAIVATGSIVSTTIITQSANIDSNVQSISTTTGALNVVGGVGIHTGNLYVGGSGGNAAVLNGDVWVIGNLMPGLDSGVANIGAPDRFWNTVHAVATSAKYADLAEKYLADKEYEIGTVVIFGGTKEITVTKQFADHRVAGVVSGEPAYLMNSDSIGTAVALRGRVPVKVVGPVAKGDLLVTSDLEGHAISVGSDTTHGIKIFAKSLEANGDLGEKIIEAVIL